MYFNGLIDLKKTENIQMTISNKDMRHVMYHAKDIDKSAVYTCHGCYKKNKDKYKDTNVFCQGGQPVTIPYICSECGKEKRCFRFTYDTKNNRSQ